MVDIVYTFQYNSANIDKALKRVKCSIESLKGQAVRIIFLNASEIDISDRIKELPVEYYHKPYGEVGMNKCKLINHAVKYLVKSSYVFLSDIDLIYPNNYIEEMTKATLFFKKKFNIEVRIVPNVLSLLDEYYCSDYGFIVSLRIPCTEGIAPGNGIIHTDTFKSIRGFDEDLQGYGPEDAMFNMRIGRVNKYIEVRNIKTFHLKHEAGANREKQDKINRIKCQKKLERIQDYSLTPQQGKKPITKETFHLLKANNENWGELI